MFRSLILAAGITGFRPADRHCGEITLLPSVKLQIGDRDDYGRYWDGGYWRDRDYWHRHYEWRGDAGGNTITADTAAGIKTMPMNAATAKAGTIVTTAAVAGVTAQKDTVVTATVVINVKCKKGAFRLLSLL